MKNTIEQMGLRSLADVLFNLIRMLNHMARHLPTNGNRQQVVCECNAEFLCLSGAIPGQLEVERRPESGLITVLLKPIKKSRPFGVFGGFSFCQSVSSHAKRGEPTRTQNIFRQLGVEDSA